MTGWMEPRRVEDPLERDPRVRAFLGERYPVLEAYAHLLAQSGVEKGLIGPRETGRLWERHLLNCAAVVPLLLPGSVADVGSGAGLPGIVIAAMEPEREVILIESMAKRAAWLVEVAGALGLSGVRVMRERAEDIRDGTSATTVVARAVAPLSRLIRWCGGLMAEGGEMLFLKGESVEDEVEETAAELVKRRLSAEVVTAETIPGVQATTLVRIRPMVG